MHKNRQSNVYITKVLVMPHLDVPAQCSIIITVLMCYRYILQKNMTVSQEYNKVWIDKLDYGTWMSSTLANLIHIHRKTCWNMKVKCFTHLDVQNTLNNLAK